MTLPNKPSELLRLALTDLEKCENNERYIIDMEEWHVPQNDGQCAICLAGAILVHEFNINTNESHDNLDSFSDEDQHKLIALDYFRRGRIDYALRELDIEPPLFLATTSYITDYMINPDKFKEELKSLASALENFQL